MSPLSDNTNVGLSYIKYYYVVNLSYQTTPAIRNITLISSLYYSMVFTNDQHVTNCQMLTNSTTQEHCHAHIIKNVKNRF